MMESVIIYWSRYGNGKKAVDYLADKMNKKDVKIKVYRTEEANPAAMPDVDIYIFSAPTEAFSIQRNMKIFMKKLNGMEEKKYGIMNTHAMKGNMLKKMEKILAKKNMIKVAEVEIKVGKEAEKGNALMDGWQKKIDEFAYTLVKK